jgi:hypothetical protein
MHSYRNVAITVMKTDSGEPVPSLPFRVIYDYRPVDGSIFYHLELRTPHEVRAETDQTGKSVVRLADYAWDIRLEVGANEKGYSGFFWLSKKLIRDGGTVEEGRYPHANATLRLNLQPTKQPGKSRRPTPGDRLAACWASAARRGCAHR